MPSDFFLAQTALEIHRDLPPGAKKAWLGCHFSPSGTGLSNVPQYLPEGSLLILTDEFPPLGHDPGRITEELRQAAAHFCCAGVLLDFQRPQEPETAAMAKAILEALPIPVGVSLPYAKALDCPVFLPPLPLTMPLAQYTAPWQGRRIWLEAASQRAKLRLTKDGCQTRPCPPGGDFPHGDETCFCKYGMELGDGEAVFTLRRSLDDWQDILRTGQIEYVIGLYQEFAQPEAQATALAQ